MFVKNFHALRVLCIQLLFLSIALGCGKKEEEEDTSAEKDPASSETNFPDAPENVLNLFLNDLDIAPSVLKSGGADCLEISNAARLSDAIEQWPPGLKAFLASELAKFPEFDLITGSVAGVFLAKESMLSFPELAGETMVAGIMCSIEGQEAGYVFLNSKLYVTDRAEVGPLEEYQDSVALVHQHVLSEHGDQALYTLIHEIFHAIDLAYFTDSENNTMVNGRVDVMTMAWNNAGNSIDQTAEIYARRVVLPSHVCSPRHLNLAPESAEEMAVAYQQIAEETSFISPYAQTNLFEDFAETLASWYFKKTYDNGLVRSVYSEDLTVTPLSSAELLYKFDTKEIMRTSSRHQEKMCAMVALVFEDQQCLGE